MTTTVSLTPQNESLILMPEIKHGKLVGLTKNHVINILTSSVNGWIFPQRKCVFGTVCSLALVILSAGIIYATFGARHYDPTPILITEISFAALIIIAGVVHDIAVCLLVRKNAVFELIDYIENTYGFYDRYISNKDVGRILDCLKDETKISELVSEMNFFQIGLVFDKFGLEKTKQFIAPYKTPAHQGWSEIVALCECENEELRTEKLRSPLIQIIIKEYPFFQFELRKAVTLSTSQNLTNHLESVVIEDDNEQSALLEKVRDRDEINVNLEIKENEENNLKGASRYFEILFSDKWKEADKDNFEMGVEKPEALAELIKTLKDPKSDLNKEKIKQILPVAICFVAEDLIKRIDSYIFCYQHLYEVEELVEYTTKYDSFLPQVKNLLIDMNISKTQSFNEENFPDVYQLAIKLKSDRLKKHCIDLAFKWLPMSEYTLDEQKNKLLKLIPASEHALFLEELRKKVSDRLKKELEWISDRHGRFLKILKPNEPDEDKGMGGEESCQLSSSSASSSS